MNWYVYIVRCRGGALYTGISKDVAARVEAHNAGRGAKYTRSRTPVVLLQMAGPMTQSEALRLELWIKKQSRDDKLSTLEGWKR